MAENPRIIESGGAGVSSDDGILGFREREIGEWGVGIGVMNGKRVADRDEAIKDGECYRRIQKVAVLGHGRIQKVLSWTNEVGFSNLVGSLCFWFLKILYYCLVGSVDLLVGLGLRSVSVNLQVM